MHDILRAVRIEGYTLTTWDTHRQDWRGQTRIGYRFVDPAGAVLFEGEDFACSPMDADDSDESLRALLGFLTLRPGDTDREYFAEYTPEQMTFAQGDAQRLSLYAMEAEDGPPAFEDIEA